MSALDKGVGIGGFLLGKFETPFVMIGKSKGQKALGNKVEGRPLVKGSVGFAGGIYCLVAVFAEGDFILAIPGNGDGYGRGANLLAIEPNVSAGRDGVNGDESFDATGQEQAKRQYC